LTDSAGRSTEWIGFFVQLATLFNTMQQTGTTVQRPDPAPWVGFPYFDTTLNKPIWADSFTTWVDATGASV
ncbi:MAG: hypothetical protein KGL39_18770, partial [Patescibacteria group bacterium]|nr:hypothetical protein [Patescibacteria group bacterium]